MSLLLVPMPLLSLAASVGGTRLPAIAGVGLFLGTAALAVVCQIPFVKVIGRSVGFLDRCALLVALGFGAGRLHPAPGTWGSLVGVLWLLALLSSMSISGFLFGAIAGVVASVWYCGRAERILGTHDPSCVVIDEISAMPLSWVGVLLLDAFQHRTVSSPFEAAFWQQWPEVVIAFVAFRVFDIWKPGWVGKSQRLHGGLGVTADDVLAALLAAIPVALVSWLRH